MNYEDMKPGLRVRFVIDPRDIWLDHNKFIKGDIVTLDSPCDDCTGYWYIKEYDRYGQVHTNTLWYVTPSSVEPAEPISEHQIFDDLSKKIDRLVSLALAHDNATEDVLKKLRAILKILLTMNGDDGK